MSIDTLIEQLAGEPVEYKVSMFDCYVREGFGIFIPIFEDAHEEHLKYKHPSYEITINFDTNSEKLQCYWATITSPDVLHKREIGRHCYSLLIEKEYFEKRFLMYAEEVPVFEEKKFEFCSDILKALNTFVFEYSKSMLNADITLDAQTEIITHWLIRSIFGETLDMRAVSLDYSVARAQHYMEQHYMDNITVEKLAHLGYMSKTSFNRRFKKEIGITPIDYLIEVRIKMAKLMLTRKSNPITEIAARCGFGSSAHFSTFFQKKAGMTPSEYRDKYAN